MAPGLRRLWAGLLAERRGGAAHTLEGGLQTAVISRSWRVVERRARSVVLGHVIDALVVGDVKDVRRADVLFDGDPAQSHFARRVETVDQAHDLVTQLDVGAPREMRPSKVYSQPLGDAPTRRAIIA